MNRTLRERRDQVAKRHDAALERDSTRATRASVNAGSPVRCVAARRMRPPCASSAPSCSRFGLIWMADLLAVWWLNELSSRADHLRRADPESKREESIGTLPMLTPASNRPVRRIILQSYS